ncbi:MAG: nitroreductase family protein [Chloroflexi bacterium]|nr:nitroreductase family protein [Chloroflexota bacterium]HEV8054005.1 nitroreductase family protein [Candidatus Limnocylindrales bacterium]
MEFREVVRRRRMVRRFEDRAVPQDALERILDAASRAPSAGFSQGQRVVVVTDRDMRRRLGELCGESDEDERWGRWVSTCGVQLVPCVSENVYHRRYRETDKVDESGTEIDWPVPYWWMDIGCTVENILLAAVDEGLGAGFAGTDREGWTQAKALLGIPDEFAPVGVMPIGYPLPDVKSPSLERGKVPMSEFALRERW